jgi:hypothetical protein
MEKSFKVLRWFWEDIDDDPIVDPNKVDKKEDDEPMYPKSELDKATARRQAALKRARVAEDKLKAVNDKLDTMPDADEYDTLKKNFDEMNKQMKDLKEYQQEEDLKKIDDDRERAKVKMEQEFAKERKALQKQMDDMNTQIDSFSQEKTRHQETLDKFRRSSLENEIVAVAGAKAYNPRQIVKLIVDDFKYDTEEERWYKDVIDSKGKLVSVLGVDEYVTAFLGDKDNENLLKADIKRGSDTPRGQRQAKDDGPPADQTPTEKMFKWADMSGLDINDKSPADRKAWLYSTYTRLHTREEVKPS